MSEAEAKLNLSFRYGGQAGIDKTFELLVDPDSFWSYDLLQIS